MAPKKKSPAESSPAESPPKERGRYVGTTYPNWQHNGKEGWIVRRSGACVFLKFDNDDGHGIYLVHSNDVEVATSCT